MKLIASSSTVSSNVSPKSFTMYVNVNNSCLVAVLLYVEYYYSFSRVELYVDNRFAVDKSKKA